MAITLNGTTGITTPDVNSDGLTVDSTTLVVDEANNRVGIGTASPSADFEIASTQPTIKLTDTDGGLSDVINVGGNLFLRADTGNTQATSHIRFDVDGSERARIATGGNLLVGKTAPGSITVGCELRPDLAAFTNSAAPALYVTRKTSDGAAVSFQRESTTVGTISVTGSSTAYNTSSDYRLKENVAGVTGASARVQQLNPVRFNFIANPDTTVDGFLAHEVQDVVPEAITGTKDATEMVDVHDEDGNVTGQEERPVYQGIDQGKLVPLLTAALQEALGKIETLEARVAALEAA